MATPAEWVLVTLTDSQQLRAARIASDRHDQPRQQNRQPTTYAQHLQGVLGEMAVAAYLGIPYEPPADIASELLGDVGGWQVRTRPVASWGLGLHNGDRAKTWFMLALAHDGPEHIWLAGYIHARQGFAVGTLRHDGNWLDDPDWWLVEQRDLLPVPERPPWRSAAHLGAC